jgi:hypothetical protein
MQHRRPKNRVIEPGTKARSLHRRLWLEENEEAIASIGSFIDCHGLLASKLRFQQDKDTSKLFRNK